MLFKGLREEFILESFFTPEIHYLILYRFLWELSLLSSLDQLF